MNKTLCAALSACLLLSAAFTAKASVSSEDPLMRASAQTSASAAECVIEISSKRILHSENADACLPMASTTKIMTAIILIEDCSLSESVTVPTAAEGVEGSSIYLKAGDVYTVEELLYGLMLRSGNDAAAALALHHSGSIRAFAQEMNERAAYLGASDTCFINPHGLPAEGHHTTARDLAIIASHAMQNPTFRTIVSTKYYAPRGWANKNKMLFEYDGAAGVKTGFTKEAGRCLVTGAERDGMTVVSVVLNCPDMYNRSATLLDRVFSKYAMRTLCTAEEQTEGCGILYDFSYPLTEEEFGAVRKEISFAEPKPMKTGEIAGQMRILLDNRLLFSQNLYIMEQ